MSRRGLEITLEQAKAHAQRHGYQLAAPGDAKTGAQPAGSDGGQLVAPAKPKLTRKDRMTRPEREMALILEARKRRGEILEWRFEGISLGWGVDPETGKAMWYTPDFLVIPKDYPYAEPKQRWKLIETKGSRLFNAQLVRFRGARSCWPNFNFELHQLAQGTWSRVE